MRKKLFTILSCMMLAIATLMAANSQVDEAMALANRLSPRLAQKVQFKQGKKKSTDYFTLSNNGDKVLIVFGVCRLVGVGACDRLDGAQWRDYAACHHWAGKRVVQCVAQHGHDPPGGAP